MEDTLVMQYPLEKTVLLRLWNWLNGSELEKLSVTDHWWGGIGSYISLVHFMNLHDICLNKTYQNKKKYDERFFRLKQLHLK